MANVGPVLWFLRDNAPTSTIGWSAVTPWAALTAVAAGVLRRQLATPAVGSERVFACIIAGTTLASEPTWTVTKGAMTAEAAGPTWQEVTGQPGVNGNAADSPTWLQNKNVAVTLGLIIFDSGTASLQIVSTAGTTGNGATPGFSATAGVTTADNTVTWTSLGLASGFGSWAGPHARLANVFGTGWAQAGDSTFVGDDHRETQSTVNTITVTGTNAAPSKIYSINHAGTLTLAGATLLAGAGVTTTGASDIRPTGALYAYGITFTYGSGANTADFSPNRASSGAAEVFDSCAIVCGSTGTNSGLLWSGIAETIFNSCSFGWAATTNGISGKGTTQFNNCTISGATFPNPLFFTSNAATGNIIFEGCDLSPLGSNVLVGDMGAINLSVFFNNCKIGSGAVIAAAQTQPGGTTVVATNCDSAGTNYQKYQLNYYGTITPETVIVRTGGASSGTPISDKIVTTANPFWVFPFMDIPIAIWNAVTGTNRVVTLAGIWNAAAVPNNDDIWIEVEYFGSAASPQASFQNNTKANNLATGSALTADSTSAWDSLVTARANTTAYSLGGVIKVATNSGRIFFCTTAGTSAGSEPGGYATAVDGGSVTDGSAVFRAAVRFTLTVTLNSPQPAMAGPIYVTVNAAKISSTFYIDPLIVLS